jgi:two-component system, OmpR family, KDP operon response regulator KdpE
MNNPTILVVDDDTSIRKFVRVNLDARDYRVLTAGDGEEALSLIKKEHLDLIILDIVMPNMNGFEVCRQIREWSRVPIIMLSAKDQEKDKLRCLELGADDYLTKPFSLFELLYRVKSILRRTFNSNQIPLQSNFNDGELEINFDRHAVHLNGQNVNLTSTEYKILSFLAMNAGRIIEPQYILERVWGQEYQDKNQLLWVNICRLRRKLSKVGEGKNRILTRPGFGYFIKERVKPETF